MSTGALDPLIHDPGRLRIVATLAALPDGDALSVTRLQDMIRLPPASLITCLRELGRAGYVRTGKTGGGGAQITVALTCDGGPRWIATPPCCGSPTTHGELSQAGRDLPDLTVLSAQVSFPRGKRARPGHKPGPAPGQRAWQHHRSGTRGRPS
jgi:hypothetical protein